MRHRQAAARAGGRQHPRRRRPEFRNLWEHISVSMLTEGWDGPDRHARAGRPRLRDAAPLRAGHRPRAAPPVVRPHDDGRFDVECADVLGIRSTSPPSRCRSSRRSRARRCWSGGHPGAGRVRDTLPRVEGYRVELPEERLTARFDDDATLELTPDGAACRCAARSWDEWRSHLPRHVGLWYAVQCGRRH